MPEQRFWRMLEELPGQQAPLAVWRNNFGDWQLFDQVLRKYLLVTGHRAASLECPTPCCYACPRRVVEYGDEDIEAVCPEQEAPPIKVAHKDLLFYKLKSSVFIKAACDAVGIDCKPSEPAGCRSSWRAGEFIAPAGDNIPVYISIQGDHKDLDEVVKTLCLLHPDPFVLMVPTRRLLSAESELTLEQRKSLFLAMEEQLVFDKKGNLRALNHGSFIFRKFLPEELRTSPVDPLPKNVFRQYGSRWQMRFQGGEAVPLNKQKGTEYLTHLLSSPGKSVSVLDLVANGAMDEQTRAAMKAGGFDVVDYQHVVQFREQLNEMEKEITEAQEYNDHGRAEKLRLEKEQFLGQLKEMVGPGGKGNRMQDPLKKPRDAVTKAIRRTIESIRKAEMNALADHLEKYIITGNEIIYNPPDEIHWETTAISE